MWNTWISNSEMLIPYSTNEIRTIFWEYINQHFLRRRSAFLLIKTFVLRIMYFRVTVNQRIKFLLLIATYPPIYVNNQIFETLWYMKKRYLECALSLIKLSSLRTRVMNGKLGRFKSQSRSTEISIMILFFIVGNSTHFAAIHYYGQLSILMWNLNFVEFEKSLFKFTKAMNVLIR